MLKKILIANRGEIAVRLIRACAEMKIRSVAIYTEPDRYALHVKRADEAHFIGDDPLGGYLNAHRIVNLAVETGCGLIPHALDDFGFRADKANTAPGADRRQLWVFREKAIAGMYGIAARFYG